MALNRNGVPAEDGFTQIVMATAGSKALHEKALATRDGNGEELKGLRVRYGELRGEGEGRGRMGFGTEEEVGEVRKRSGYVQV
jgi:hypothetical protein